MNITFIKIIFFDLKYHIFTISDKKEEAIRDSCHTFCKMYNSDHKIAIFLFLFRK